jgi:hypothetical protein
MVVIFEAGEQNGGIVLDKLGEQISRVVLCFVTVCYRFGRFMMGRFFSF